ncbi:MAG: aldolase/citrate lyase family protein [Alphaproteobacteria bacterium]|nr:aldolase/citrate lyase family protein [Alphaproteobacteria bacterium]
MTFRALLSRAEPQLGTMVAEFATPGIGHILKAANLDFAFLDMEHSGFGIGSLKTNLTFFQAAGVPVVLRPPSKARHHISRVLDAGAEALLLPMVGSGDEAAELVAAMRYPPEGERGVALGMAHDRYTTGDPATKLRDANNTNVMIPLIETAAGLKAVEAIARTSGVDALWIGHFDLSASLGIPGAFSDPRFIDAVTRIVAAAKDADIPLCQLVATPEDGRRMIEMGFHLICYGVDSAVLRDSLAAGAQAIRATAKPLA